MRGSRSEGGGGLWRALVWMGGVRRSARELVRGRVMECGSVDGRGTKECEGVGSGEGYGGG